MPWFALLEVILADDRTGPGSVRMVVDARGYSPDYLPIVENVESDGTREVVINGYNEIMKALKDSYRQALERNDSESYEIIALMLHELYHHISAASTPARPPEERHLFATRTEMMRAFVSVIGKYADLRSKG